MAARKKAKKSRAVKKPARKPAKKAARKKTPARKVAVKAKKKAPAKKKKQVKGEGDYAASRAFFKDQAGFVKKNKARIPAMGKAAKAALEGREGAGLRAAEAKARKHAAPDTPDEPIVLIPPG